MEGSLKYGKKGDIMQKVKVLVVDDNKRIVSLLKDVLSRDEQMQVVGTAGDGEEAIKMITFLKPDVVLLDLIMPKIDGLGVMERLNHLSLEKKPKIIVVSAISQESVTENAFSLGAAYYILKPFDTRVILSRVKAVGVHDVKESKVISTVFTNRKTEPEST